MSLYYENYTFREQQWLYLSDAVERITAPVAFAPDGKMPAQVQALASGYGTALGVLTDATLEAQDKRAARDAAHIAGHAAAVTVYACMKSCYRHDRACRATIMRLPKNDSSPAQTLKRMDAIARRWEKLPNLPGGSAPLAAAGAITKVSFAALKTALATAIGDEVEAEQAETGAAQTMRDLDRVAESFINAALTQGRAIFAPGTTARAIIDAIPTEPSTQLPDQALIELAESPGEGVVHLVSTAGHATSFKVLHKAPGAADFTQAGLVLLPGDFVATGLAGGQHQYKVVGINSRGEGPASEVTTVDVAEAAAA